MTEDDEDPCPSCNNKGHIDDPLANAMGGRWFRYCECHAGIAAEEEDQAARQQAKLTRDASKGPYLEEAGKNTMSEFKALEIQANSLHEAASEGMRARQQGQPRTNNPHLAGSGEQAMWDDGWLREDIFSEHT